MSLSRTERVRVWPTILLYSFSYHDPDLSSDPYDRRLLLGYVIVLEAEAIQFFFVCTPYPHLHVPLLSLRQT